MYMGIMMQKIDILYNNKNQLSNMTVIYPLKIGSDYDKLPYVK